MFSTIKNMFHKQTKISSLEAMGLPPVRFYKEAIYYGEHGRINVSNIRLGVKAEGVSFVFVGMAKPPKMDLTIMTYIWEQAKSQGYIPHHIEAYGYDFDAVMVEEQVPVSAKESVA